MRTWRRHARVFICGLLTFLSACADPLATERDTLASPAPRSAVQLDAARDPAIAAPAEAGTPARTISARDAGVRTEVSFALDASPARDAAPSVEASLGGEASAPDASSLARDGGTPLACQGKPGARRGKSNHTLEAGGARRSFVYYAPMNLAPNEPVPLVIVAHGTNMSGQGMYDITRYAALADRERAVVVFPDGIDGPGSWAPWNVGNGVCGLGAAVANTGNDQAFLTALIQFAEQDQCIDGQHVFMTGFSMGGYFSHETACQGGRIAAIAAHSAGTHDLSRCPGKPTPVIMFHFTSDSLIDYACGTAARDQWVKRNGCVATGPDVLPVKGGTCEYYKGCMAGAQVAFCAFDPPAWADDGLPSGHGWSGGAKVGAESFGAISNSESATELGFAFFKKYAW